MDCRSWPRPLVVVLHRWKKNALFSIFGGTAFYMLLVQVVLV